MKSPVKEGPSLEKLMAWQKARELMLFVHQQIVPALPVEEKWDLASQIRRSSKSVMANVAEGHGRYYYQETVRFCYMARGSLEETFSHLVAGRDLGYISDSHFQQAVDLTQETLRILSGYIAYLKRSKRGGELPAGRLKEVAEDYCFEEDLENDNLENGEFFETTS